MADTQTPNTAELAREISAIEDPLNPLASAANAVTTPYVALMTTSDEVLRQKGGIEHLRVYRELLRDDQVASTWQQRRLSLTGGDTVVEAGADDAASKAAAEALDAELKAMNWDDITDKALYAIFYGWGVAEVMWRPEGSRIAFDSIRVRERGRFRFGYDRSLHLWTSAHGFVQMPEQKFWTVTAGGDNHDEPYGLGLAHQLYWPVFFKRNDIKFWLTFLEKFGQPTALAKLPAGQIDDPAQRRKAVAMLRQIATDAGVVVGALPDGSVPIELLEAARSGAADYEGMCKAMDAAISKIIVGQTMTTDNGASLSQAKVHEGVKQSITAADSDLLCGSFNQGPVKWWTQWNFPGATPPRVYRHTDPAEDLTARAERDSKIFALGYEPTEDYIKETYGDGWEKKQAPAVTPGMVPGQPVSPGQQRPGNADPAQFAEGELAALAALRAARRGDQQALAEAARTFAEQYDTLMGRRIGQVLDAVEFADGDADLFRQRLNELLAEAPPVETVDKLQRAGLFARLMGVVRAQRA